MGTVKICCVCKEETEPDCKTTCMMPGTQDERPICGSCVEFWLATGDYEYLGDEIGTAIRKDRTPPAQAKVN